MDLLLLHRCAFYLLLGLVWGSAGAEVLVVPLEGAVGPASSDFVSRAIKRGAKEKAELVVIRMDTPGGLDTSMRSLIKDILASPVPVATFVAPSGSRAASAGTFILYASHIAAMAPGTNLGAASPVSIGGGGSPQPKDEKKGSGPDTMTKKVTNDAVAYIRGLAEMRKRNADWAEKAVREAVSLSAPQALKLKVIDYVAADVPDLLKQLGKSGTAITYVEVDWRTRVLAAVTNPSIAYILILVGIYALIFEFMNPGLILPGVVGAICLLIALYAFQLLPVNYAGLALIVVGIAFMVAEAFLPAFGSLGVGGLIAFVIGSVLLIDEDTTIPGFEIPYALIAGVAAASAAFIFFVFAAAIRSRKRPVVSGREYLIGSTAQALEDFEREGWARVQGETWRARSSAPVRRGQRLRVKSIEGLVLTVEAEP